MKEEIKKHTKQKTEQVMMPAKDQIGQNAGQVAEPEHRRPGVRRRAGRAVRSLPFILAAVIAAVVIIVVLFLPILRIYGKSMEQTLDSGDIVLSVKTDEFETGDVIAFYYNNNILVKRVIAVSGDIINIDKGGNVTVNNVRIEEPYLLTKAYGDVNIEFPYQVPDGRLFVMGDNREVSLDSRNASIGCVAAEQIVGKVRLRIWPLNRIGMVKSYHQAGAEN